MEIDLMKALREELRWRILTTTNIAGGKIGETLLLSVVHDMKLDVSQAMLRKELSYLAARELLACSGQEHEVWDVTLTRHGIDVVEYTVPVEPGIARPPKRGS